MGELTGEAFADWLHPSDALDWFISLGEERAKRRVSAMLRDGLLRAASLQLIVDGRDRGLSLIPRELWEIAIHPGLWSTGEFRVRVSGQTISAYDVRIDRDTQSLPPPDSAPVSLAVSDQMPPKRGGRPPAPWWDDLWVEICRQLYSGDLKPDSQAEIERAMHDWLAARGESVGDTTIRTRASRLFQALIREDRN